MSIGLFVDVSNLYYCVNKRFNSKIDYKKYLEKIGPVDHMVAYGTYIKDEAKGFIKSLKGLGFSTKFVQTTVSRQTSLNVDIAVDIFMKSERLTKVILGTSNRDLTPLINWLRSKGIKVSIVACGIPTELKNRVDGITEIDDEILEIQNVETNDK